MATTLGQIEREVFEKNLELETTYDVQLDGPATQEASFILNPTERWMESIVTESEERLDILREANELLDSDEMFYCYFADSIKKYLNKIIRCSRVQDWNSVLLNTEALINIVKFNFEVY